MFLTLPFFFCWVVIFYCAVICLCFGLGLSGKTNMSPIALLALPLAILSMYSGYWLTKRFWHYPEFWTTLFSGK